MSIEIANVIHALGRIAADATPELLRADGITAVTRPGAGRFKCVLAQKVAAAEVECFVSIGPIASPGLAVPYWEVDADGDIEVICRNATVNTDPDGEVSLVVFRYPTIG